MSFSVVIGTYGAQHWTILAQRAMASVIAQDVPPKEIIHVHGATLHQARNQGAQAASGEYLIFLDADDTLDHRYLAAMQLGYGDLRQPATLGVYPDGREDAAPVLIPERDLRTGNFMVIGTAVRRELFFQVGGFRDWPILEDWDLWIRCWLAGAKIGKVPDAIYRVGVNGGGRNTDIPLHHGVFSSILLANGLL